MRAHAMAFCLSAVLFAGAAAAYDADDPNNCNGVDWDDTRALIVAKVTARPRVNFIKSPYDDDFSAATCPAATAACLKKSYLVTDDLVLVGKTRSDFTCVSYQSPMAKKQTWIRGWLPRAALTSVAPMPSPRTPDWLGSWTHPGGHIEIKNGGSGKLHVEGKMVVPGAQDVHTGVIGADATPRRGILAFVHDGSIPFDKTDAGECRVRMQRVGPWLMVEDNDGCGGAGVTFTGLYRRNK